jgi:hypothetical protein
MVVTREVAWSCVAFASMWGHMMMRLCGVPVPSRVGWHHEWGGSWRVVFFMMVLGRVAVWCRVAV